MSLSGPIITAGALKAQKGQAVAAWEQTRVQYLQTALTAFRDVSDALITREKLDAIHTEQEKMLQSNEDDRAGQRVKQQGGEVRELARQRTGQRAFACA